jgi:hypothetical protein
MTTTLDALVPGDRILVWNASTHSDDVVTFVSATDSWHGSANCGYRGQSVVHFRRADGGIGTACMWPNNAIVLAD